MLEGARYSRVVWGNSGGVLRLWKEGRLWRGVKEYAAVRWGEQKDKKRVGRGWTWR